MSPVYTDERITRQLAKGEQVLWSGKPKQGLMFRAADLYLVPFSLFWCGFMVFWNVAVNSAAHGREAPPMFKIVGVVFLAIGLHFVFGRFLVDLLQRRRTLYAVTTSRVLIVSGLVMESVDSISLRGLSQVRLKVRSDGSGEILFGPATPFEAFLVPGWPGAGQMLTARFDAVPDAREVHDLIVHAQSVAG